VKRAALAPFERTARAQRNLRATAGAWLVAAIAIAGAYLARDVLIPITLSIFLSFILAPIAEGFRRMHLGRVPSVFLAVTLALGFVGVSGAILVSQASTLIDDAPAYVQHLSEKTGRVHAAIVARLGFLTHEGTATSQSRTRTRNLTRGAKSVAVAPAAPIPVELRSPPPSPIEQMETLVGPLMAPLGTTAIVIVLTIFMLLQKEDLRDRAIRIFGVGDLHRSTMALSDAGKRLSRYFLSQLGVNACFGFIVWLGMMAIGVPAPGLWGVLAGLLRFAPYIGTMIAACLPIVVATAVSPGWTMALEVAALFAFIEPLVGYGVEPLLYGRSTGLSPIAVIVAALFWTWLWGLVGLVLSMPLTLMLVVLGRHVPQFAFFDILLGDRPALSLPETFYQRMLAGHHDEALDQAAELLATIPPAEYFDTVVLGALRLAASDADRGAVGRADLNEVCQTTVEVIEQLHDLAGLPPPEGESSHHPGGKIVCIPTRGNLNVAFAAATQAALERTGYDVVRVNREDTMQKALAAIDMQNVKVVCLLGLFEDRAIERVHALRDQIASRWPGIAVIAAVMRDGQKGALQGERTMPHSLAELLARIEGAAA